MRPVHKRFFAIALLVFPITLALADARSDLRIKTEENEERYKIFKLANDGETPIKATVKLTKRCSGVTSNQKPKSNDYWIQPNTELELGRAWARSTCRRDYRIVRAEYI